MRKHKEAIFISIHLILILIYEEHLKLNYLIILKNSPFLMKKLIIFYLYIHINI